MLIANGIFNHQSLADKVALVTGAGGGIGYEAARALLWLGAKVVIAEIDELKGKQAETSLDAEFGNGSALFVQADVGDEIGVQKLHDKSIGEFGKVDIVINNATLALLGAVKDVRIEDWDASYRVNLRAPALLARIFLPEMIARRYGVFMCVSSLGQEFMAAYEAMKAAQVHLGSTLAAELEGTGVYAFTIGPGYVPTRTAEESIPKLAALMDKPTDELFSIVKQYELPVGIRRGRIRRRGRNGGEVRRAGDFFHTGLDRCGHRVGAVGAGRVFYKHLSGRFRACIGTVLSRPRHP